MFDFLIVVMMGMSLVVVFVGEIMFVFVNFVLLDFMVVEFYDFFFGDMIYCI